MRKKFCYDTLARRQYLPSSQYGKIINFKAKIGEIGQIFHFCSKQTKCR